MSAQKFITSQSFSEIEKVLTKGVEQDAEAFHRAFDNFSTALDRLTRVLDSTKFANIK